MRILPSLFIAGLLVPTLANANLLGFSGGTLNSDYTYDGGPSINGSQLTLTRDQSNEHASWFYNATQNVTAFDVSFDYTQNSAGIPSDGMAFVLQDTAAGDQALSTQDGGSGLGYYGMNPSAALEFNIAPIHVQGTNLAVDGTDSNLQFNRGCSVLE